MDLHPGPTECKVLETRRTVLDPIRRALQENDDWYQDLVEHSQDLLCIHDLTGRLLAINPAPARLLGYSVEELLQTPMRELVPPKARAKFDAYLAEIERMGEARGLLAVMTRSGEQRIWEFHNTLRTEGVASPIIRGIAHDVTEQKQKEYLLRETSEHLFSEARENERIIGELELFRTLVDNCNDAVEVVDPKTLRFLDVNQKACWSLGYSREELLSLTVLDIDPKVTAASGAKIAEELRSAGSLVVESEHRRKDGSVFPVEVSMKWVGLDREYVVAIAHDLTGRKQAEARLQASESRYRALHDRAPVGICRVETISHRFLEVNPTFCEIVGRTEQDMLERSIESITHPDDLGKSLGTLGQLAAGELRHYSIEKRYMRPDGSVRWVEAEIVAMWPEEARPTWHMAIVQDITERRLAEEALRTSERHQHKIAKQLEAERARLIEAQAVAKVGSWEAELPSLDITWSEQTHRIFETDPSHFHPSRPGFVEFIHPEDRAKVDAAFRASLDEGAASNIEYRIVMADGRLKVLEEQWRVFYDEQGQPIRLMGTCRDISEQKQAEEASRRSEENYRMFVSQSSEGIFRQDMDAPVSIDLPEDELVRHILYDSYMAECNDAQAAMYGLKSGKEFVGKRLTEMLPPEDPHNIELTRDYIRSGFRIIDRESHEVDIHGNPKVFLNSMIGVVENGMLMRTWGIQRDVTEKVKLEEARREAEEALRKSEAHFRILVEQASDGIFVADAQGRYCDVNSAGAEMLGYSRGELLRLSIADIVAAEEVPRIAGEKARFSRGNVTRTEWKFRRKDGSFFPGELVGRQLPDGRLQGILRDITERRQAEEALRQSEQRFRVALDGSPIKVFNQDRDLRYTWIYNPEEGRTEQDYLGKTDEEIFDPETAAQMIALKRPVLETGRGTRAEFALTARGKTCYHDVTVEPLFDAAGKVIGVNCASVDVTHLRQITDELRLAKEKLSEEKLYLEQTIDAELGFGEIIGRSPALQEVMGRVGKVAPSDATVLLLGETGTGKELVARAIHRLSKRKNNSFVKMNCAAIPSGLLESELFGHEKGAFTGAVARKLGRLELADRGTLFLDEIGEIPLELQPKLLRVLQDQEFERLGGTQTLKVDFRLIAATNRDLQNSIKRKEFRSDLYYRLNVFPLHTPALRERREDIPLLIDHFVRKHASRMGKSILSIPARTMETLVQWSWPGNIRELENFVERSVILTPGKVLQSPLGELHAEIEPAAGATRDKERDRILRALRECHGQLGGPNGAAARLGLKRTTLQSKLTQFAINPGAYRA